MPFPTFKSKADVPKGFESVYEEQDGEWVAKLPDSSKLEETLAKVREEKKAEGKSRKDAEERAADLQRQLDAKSATGQEADKKVSEMLAKWQKDRDEAVAAVAKERDEANAKVRTLVLDDKVKAAALKAEIIPELVDDVLHNTKSRFDLEGDRIIVKDADGKPSTATVEDFFGKQYRKERPHYYVGTRANGGGQGGQQRSGAPSTGGPSGDEILKDPRLGFDAGNKKAA